MAQKLLGFHISDAQYERLRTTLDKVNAASDKRPFAMELFAHIETLSDIGLDYFFVQPLRRAKIGGFTIKAVEVAMNLGKSGVLKLGKGIIKGMDSAQIAIIAEVLENSLTERPSPANESDDNKPVE